MPATFAPTAVLDQLVAARALTQLNLQAVMARAMTGDYGTDAFERGQTVTFRRVRTREATDYDPRSGTPASSTEQGYISGQLELERLWTEGYPLFSHDAPAAAVRQATEYGEQAAFAINTPNEQYLYQRFRTWSLPASGSVRLGVNAPIAIVAAQATTGNAFVDYNRRTHVQAGAVLDIQNCPPTNRRAIISSMAKAAFISDSVLAEGSFYTTGQAPSPVVVQGVPLGTFIDRYGLMTAGSNAVTGQTAVADLSTVASNQASLPITATALNTDFLIDDRFGNVSLGAVTLTLDPGAGSLQNVAVGQIARLGPDAAPASAYGVVLRVTGANVVLVPFSPMGMQMEPAQIVTGTDRFSIPAIPSVNLAFHSEAAIFCTRPLLSPSDGSGATMTQVADPRTGLSMQLFAGSYNVDLLRESRRYVMLTGARMTDYRKACLVLSL